MKKKSETMGIWKALKKVNSFVFVNAPFWYLTYIVISVLLTGAAFLNLYFAEYTTSSAWKLFTGQAAFPQVMSMVLWLSAGLLAFLALRIVGEIVWEKLRLKTRYHFEKNLLDQTSRVQYDYYESHDNNLDIYNVCTKSFAAFENYIKSTVLYVTMIPLVAIYAWYLAQINPVMVLVYLFLSIALSLFSGKIFGQLGDMWQEIQPFAQRQKYFFSIGSEKDSHQECQSCRLYPYIAGKWNMAYDEEYKIRIKIFSRYEISMQTVRLIYNLPYIMMLTFVVYEIVQGRHEIGFLAMANGLLNNIIDSVELLQENIAQNQQDKEFVGKFEKVLGMHRDKGRQDENAQGCELVLTDVRYRYPQASSYALEGITFQVAKGEKIALVGVNGSGKTTCMMIVLGLLHGQGNQRLFKNGRPQRELISCILQDFAQYQMSIRENIQAGCIGKALTDDEVYGLLHAVGMEEFVRRQEKGLDTMLGQLGDGIDLSKGQWQRIAIARLLANPAAELWILDEPTAYLDPMTEIEIYLLIQELSGDRAVIFISHRLGFVRNADRIIVFEKGKVALSGKHAELMEQGGIYAEMYESQKQWYR